ncbi:MAG: FMN-binding protein [Candidatus Omnitrophica bacterium]|nr:FMN-binding protein [Candidatus Omnitrophota bacterium]
MRVLLKMNIVLAAVASLSGFLLAFVSAKSDFKIKENQKKEIERAISDLMPGFNSFAVQDIKSYQVFSVFDGFSKQLGYVLAASGSGYQGEIKLLIALNYNLEVITGIRIIENVETPGLGAKIADSFFTDRFKGLKTSAKISCFKSQGSLSDNSVQAITGATISSASVSSIVNRALSDVVPELK